MQDLTGQNFGKLTVKEFSHTKNKQNYWVCSCECGKIKKIRDYCLTLGRTLSCGCLAGKRISNRRFGKLKTIKQTRDINGELKWECLCKCGNTILVDSNSLTSGNTQSCGCLAKRRGPKNPTYRGFGEISKTFWSTIIINATDRHIDFNITIEYAWQVFLNQDRKCALTKQPLQFPVDSIDFKKNGKMLSLDRIDNSKGYVEGNVWWVLKEINSMKNSYSLDHFINLCKLVAENN